MLATWSDGKMKIKGNDYNRNLRSVKRSDRADSLCTPGGGKNIRNMGKFNFLSEQAKNIR